MFYIKKEQIFGKIVNVAIVLTISGLLAMRAKHHILIFFLAIVFLAIYLIVATQIMRLEEKQTIHKIYAKIIYCILGGIVFFFYKLTELGSEVSTSFTDPKLSEILTVLLIVLFCASLFRSKKSSKKI